MNTEPTLTEQLAMDHPCNVPGVTLMILAQKTKAEYSGTTWPQEESAKAYLIRRKVYNLN